MRHNNKIVEKTFADRSTQWAWAKISDLDDWLRIKDGAPDGCTNVFILLNVAQAHGRKVDLEVDTDNLITSAYLRAP